MTGILSPSSSQRLKNRLLTSRSGQRSPCKDPEQGRYDVSTATRPRRVLFPSQLLLALLDVKTPPTTTFKAPSLPSRPLSLPLAWTTRKVSSTLPVAAQDALLLLLLPPKVPLPPPQDHPQRGARFCPSFLFLPSLAWIKKKEAGWRRMRRKSLNGTRRRS